MANEIIPNGKVVKVEDIGFAIRAKRKSDGLTQAEAAGLCGVGVRFFSEVERGKNGAEIGKVLKILRGTGLELSIALRGGGGSRP